MFLSCFTLLISITQIFAACEETYLVTCESLIDIKFNKNRHKWTELVVEPDKYADSPPHKHKLTAKILDGSLSNLQRLCLVNQVMVLERNAFVYLENLQHLVLYNNDVKTLYKNSFVRLGRLEKVTLVNNNIENVQQNAFHTCKLKKVDLSDNKIEQFRTQWFKKCAVEELILARNRVENVEVGDGLSMKILRLDHNQLTSVTNEMMKFDQLEELTLNHNRIYTVVEFTLPRLKKLDLSFNNIDALGTELDGLKHLQHLNLARNRLKKFAFTPSMIVNMNDKFEIFLAYNRLRGLNLHEINGTTRVVVTLSGNPWNCACFDNMVGVINSGGYIVSTICDRRLLDGRVPSCVITDFNKDKCSTDYDLTDEQFETFKTRAQDKSCDVFNDFSVDVS